MISFQHIEFLLFLSVIPVLVVVFLYAIWKKKKIALKIADPHLLSSLIKTYHPGKYLVKFLLFLIAITITVLGLANLRSPNGDGGIARNGIDVMLALDVSKSMMAQDIKPSRLERAKQVLVRVIDKIAEDRVGIVIFAGKAYLQMPLTADHSAAKMYLSAASPETVPTQGTVIGDALKMSYSAFDNKLRKYKAVILISDGEDHDEGAESIAKQMAGEGIVIHTVGFGSSQGAPIPDESGKGFKKDRNGNAIISIVNEEELNAIATNGKGKYQLFNNTDAVVNALVQELNTMDQRPVTDNSVMNYENYFQIFLAIAFIFLLIEFFLSEKKKAKRNKLMPVSVMIILFFFTNPLYAQDENLIIKQGNEAYNKKDYETAAGQYQMAARSNPESVPANYNLGNALYKNGKKEEALRAYDKSEAQTKVPVEKSNTYYNKGVVYQNNKQISECIAMYKRALKISPNDEDARQNLQKALRKQKEQQDQNKQKDNKDKQNKGAPPKPQNSKMTRQDAEEKLNALMQQEKNLQDKLHKLKSDPVKPEKDW